MSIYIIQEHRHWHEFMHDFIRYNQWSYLHCMINKSLVLASHVHLCCFDERILERAEFSQRAHEQRNSGDSFKRLWLATAFINSTESRVIGYNAQLCKNTKK